MVRAVAPGRVNLMGDHTDHVGGLVLPMAIDLHTTVEGERTGDVVELRSGWSIDPALVRLDEPEPARVEPAWARYVAAVVAEVKPLMGLRGTVTTTLPVGAGLSSSAALEVAVALALGFRGTPLELAELARRAEHAASGVPCGIMDQLAITAAVAGHALRIDCTSLAVQPVRLPEDLAVVVVHSGESRSLAGSAYAERVGACRAAEAIVGPLRLASRRAVEEIADPVLRRRARHVVTENARVDEMASALTRGDHGELSRVMAASHASLRDDFEVSTAGVDRLVGELVATPGVVGARLTGAGFGGCVVAIVEPGSTVAPDHRSWWLEAAGPAA